MLTKEESAKARQRASFISRAKKKHGNRFNYDCIPLYIPEDKKIVLRCREHGKFNTTTKQHTTNKHGGCKECSVAAFRKARGHSLESFIERATALHGDRYDYSKVVYINAHIPVTIICSIHGEFEQQPQSHLAGSNCGKCACKSNATNIWTTTGWKEAGEYSKAFEAFKLYIIFCVDFETGEKFVKIGKTFAKISHRFPGKTAMPYDYVVLFEYEGSAELISKFEHTLHKYCKAETYTPTKEFGGQTECFKPNIDFTIAIPEVLTELLSFNITYTNPDVYISSI